MKLFPELTDNLQLPSHVYRAQIKEFITWGQIFPADSELRYINDAWTMANLGIAYAMDPEGFDKELLYDARFRKAIYGDSRFDMIINKVAYRSVDIIGDHFVVIVGRDEKKGNQYGLFHKSLRDKEDIF